VSKARRILLHQIFADSIDTRQYKEEEKKKTATLPLLYNKISFPRWRRQKEEIT
jgi:hypothetical protein